MALSEKYGELGIPRISEDEPVFILRAQNKLATPVRLDVRWQGLGGSYRW